VEAKVLTNIAETAVEPQRTGPTASTVVASERTDANVEMVPLRVGPFAGDAASWDAFGARQPGWTHFHAHGWRDVIEQVFGHECLYYAAEDGTGQLAGVLPLVRVRSRLFGHYLVSMPFLNYGGPLGSDAAVRALCDAAVQEAERSGAKLMELRSAVPLPVSLPVSHRKVTVLLDLPDDEDVMWKGLNAKVRSQVRRPQKDGVSVRTGLDQIPAFYEVFARHMRDLGTPVMPRAFFERIAATFPAAVRIAVAYMDSRPVATGLGFRYGDEFEITWASSLVEVKRSAPNMLVYWELMRGCVQEGVRRFNFGRCTPGGGTHRFKLQWGGRDAPLYWYQRAARPDSATPSPDEGAFAWGPGIWKRLPVPVATALGPRIVKYIP
jgi:FemAB-related protein (PEP-CTERM system-associated)